MHGRVKADECKHDGQCGNEQEDRRDRIDRSRGVFGFGADWEKIAQIQNEKLPSCEKLRKLESKYSGGRTLYH